MTDVVITRDGLARLTEELERLTLDGRREIAERLADAAGSAANAAENADYLVARDDQAVLEQRIAVLEDRLRSAQVVEPERGNGRIDVGERVRIRDLESGERLEVELVGPLESDLAADRVSVASPVGRAIVGRRRGEIVDVAAPNGNLRFKILAVEA